MNMAVAKCKEFSQAFAKWILHFCAVLFGLMAVGYITENYARSAPVSIPMDFADNLLILYALILPIFRRTNALSVGMVLQALSYVTLTQHRIPFTDRIYAFAGLRPVSFEELSAGIVAFNLSAIIRKLIAFVDTERDSPDLIEIESDTPDSEDEYEKVRADFRKHNPVCINGKTFNADDRVGREVVRLLTELTGDELKALSRSLVELNVFAYRTNIDIGRPVAS